MREWGREQMPKGNRERGEEERNVAQTQMPASSAAGAGAGREGGTTRCGNTGNTTAPKTRDGSYRATMDGDSDSCTEPDAAPKTPAPPEAYAPSSCANTGCPERIDDPDPKSDDESVVYSGGDLRDLRNNFSAVMNSYRDVEGALALSKEQQIRATEFAAALGYNKDPHRTSDLAGMLLHHHQR